MHPPDHDGDFGFIAAREPSPASGPWTEGEAGLVLYAVSCLLDWRSRPSFRAIATVRWGEDAHEYHVLAQPSAQAYEVTDALTGSVLSYDPATGTTRDGVPEGHFKPYQCLTEPVPVRLAFPLSLGIWGRPIDSYRITGAREEGASLIVALSHREDSSLTGELFIDQKTRRAIRLSTPTLSIEYTDIRSAL